MKQRWSSVWEVDTLSRGGNGRQVEMEEQKMLEKGAKASGVRAGRVCAYLLKWMKQCDSQIAGSVHVRHSQSWEGPQMMGVRVCAAFTCIRPAHPSVACTAKYGLHTARAGGHGHAQATLCGERRVILIALAQLRSNATASRLRAHRAVISFHPPALILNKNTELRRTRTSPL